MKTLEVFAVAEVPARERGRAGDMENRWLRAGGNAARDVVSRVVNLGRSGEREEHHRVERYLAAYIGRGCRVVELINLEPLIRIAERVEHGLDETNGFLVGESRGSNTTEETQRIWHMLQGPIPLLPGDLAPSQCFVSIRDRV